MDHESRTAWLEGVAIAFFIAYWLIAGPGSYLFLASKKRTGLSWTVFGAAALAATLVTVGVVRLVLTGDPAVKHISFVRLTPAGSFDDGSAKFDAVVNSRFGLYIPRDGDQRVSLPQTTVGEVSYITPFAIHPEYLRDNSNGFTDQARYEVATDGLGEGKAVEVAFPFRSTVKKIQAQWSGPIHEGVDGAVTVGRWTDTTVDPRDATKRLRTAIGPVSGKVTNRIGRDLRSVYFAFHEPGHAGDSLLYIKGWPNGATLDLNAEWKAAVQVDSEKGDAPLATPRNLRGDFGPNNAQQTGWGRFWYWGLRVPTVIDEGPPEDDSDEFNRSLPLMAFIDRVEPYKAYKDHTDRVELFRRGGRQLNVSGLLAAGKLVVLGQATGPVPYRLDVNGDPIKGEGLTIYEAALPITYVRPPADAAAPDGAAAAP